MQLFRVSPRPHPPGFVFSAGHWAAGYNDYTIRGRAQDPVAAWRLAGEFIIEHVRAREFPNRPSRLNCCFAWPDEPTARLSLSQSPAGYCIEVVEPLDPEANRFIADFALLLAHRVQQPDVNFVPHVQAIARQYWTGGNAAAPELLIESDLRLIRVLS